MHHEDEEVLNRLCSNDIPPAVVALYQRWRKVWNHNATDPCNAQVLALMVALVEKPAAEPKGSKPKELANAN